MFHISFIVIKLTAENSWIVLYPFCVRYGQYWLGRETKYEWEGVYRFSQPCGAMFTFGVVRSGHRHSFLAQTVS